MSGPEDPFDPNVNMDPSPADYDGDETVPFLSEADGDHEGDDDDE